MAGFGWHRLFHPLSGADPLTLIQLVRDAGPPSLRGALPFGVALAASLGRLPFTLAESAVEALRPARPVTPPVFIVGFPRSGTTHLHNLMAASGQFTTVPPVLAGMPWEARSLAPILRRFVEPYLPRTRLIDEVRLDANSPTEDEVALANMGRPSYFHGLYFPRVLRRAYREGLLLDPGSRSAEDRARALTRYAGVVAGDGSRPLLLKNPAYTGQLDWLVQVFPDARIVHIHRDPLDVFASNRRALHRALGELALQDWSASEIDATILELYPCVMERLLAQSRGRAGRRLAHVGFDDLVEDPQSELRRIWDELDLPSFDASQQRISAYLSTVSDYRQAPNALDQATIRRVSEAWRGFVDAYHGTVAAE